MVIGGMVGAAFWRVAAGHLPSLPATPAPVVAADGALAGVMTLADVGDVPAEQRAATAVASAMTPEPVTIVATEGLDDALEGLATHGISWMPVIDAERHVLGIVTAANITAAYREALTSGVRRLDALIAGTSFLEITVARGARVAGKTLALAHLPRGVLIVSLRRDGMTAVPRGDTELCAGDVVTVIADPKQEEQVRAFFIAAMPEARAVPATPAS